MLSSLEQNVFWSNFQMYEIDQSFCKKPTKKPKGMLSSENFYVGLKETSAKVPSDSKRKWKHAWCLVSFAAFSRHNSRMLWPDTLKKEPVLNFHCLLLPRPQRNKQTQLFLANRTCVDDPNLTLMTHLQLAPNLISILSQSSLQLKAVVTSRPGRMSASVAG